MTTDTLRRRAVTGGWFCRESGVLLAVTAFVVALLLVIPAAMAESSPLCAGRHETLRCLKDNFDPLYQTDYARFFRIFHTAEQKAIRCNSLPHTTEYLELAPFMKGNAEVREGFSETVENLSVNAPRCFLNSLIRTNRESQAEIIKGLRTPLFVDEAVIRTVFLWYRGETRYKTILQLYFQK